MVVRLGKVFVFLLMHLCSVSAYAKVSIFINQQAFEYDMPVRLNQVLAPVSSSTDWYWPASAVYDLNDPTAETLKKETLDLILSELKRLDSDDADYIVLDNVYRQVSSWSVATRKHVEVSYNLARVYPSKNPMFQPGKYLIRLFMRPEVTHVSGAVKTAGAYQFKNNSELASISHGVALSPNANNSDVWVISPQGEVSIEGKAYWNKGFNQLMPGSQLYFPVSESLFSSSIAKINERVAQLAVHRILP